MSSIFSFFFGKGRRCTRGAATRPPFPGGSPFSCTLFVVHTSCEAIRPFRAGDFALCGARERAARAAGAKREGHLRFPSLFELLPFPQQPRERACGPTS